MGIETGQNDIYTGCYLCSQMNQSDRDACLGLYKTTYLSGRSRKATGLGGGGQ